jgi:hypothetical protein
MHQIGANTTPKLFLAAPHCKIFDVKLMAEKEGKNVHGEDKSSRRSVAFNWIFQRNQH